MSKTETNDQTLSPPSSKPLPSLQFAIPIMTQEQFAQGAGLSHGVVRGWIDKGYLPTLLIGKHRMVNVAMVFRNALTGSNP